MRRAVGAIHLWAVIVLALGHAGCHGRPLRTQLAPRSPSPADGPAGAGEWRGIPEGRLARRLRGLAPPRPPALTDEQVEAIRRARALRNPARSLPRGACATAVDRAEALAREFAGMGNPAKAAVPGSIGLDVGRVVRAVRQGSR